MFPHFRIGTPASSHVWYPCSLPYLLVIFLHFLWSYRSEQCRHWDDRFHALLGNFFLFKSFRLSAVHLTIVSSAVCPEMYALRLNSVSCCWEASSSPQTQFCLGYLNVVSLLCMNYAISTTDKFITWQEATDAMVAFKHGSMHWKYLICVYCVNGVLCMWMYFAWKCMRARADVCCYHHINVHLLIWLRDL